MAQPFVSPHANTTGAPRLFSPIAFLVAGWLALTTTGAAWLTWYATRPGAIGHPPAHLSASAASNSNPRRPALLMFAHPLCPCTQASLEELARIMAQVNLPVDARVVFLTTPHPTPDWSDSDLVRFARSIPGVRVEFDPGGARARQFSALTSGVTLVYDAAGKLRFSGGITAARAHAGDNAGADAVLALLITGQAILQPQGFPVFGCALTDHDNHPARGRNRGATP